MFLNKQVVSEIIAWDPMFCFLIKTSLKSNIYFLLYFYIFGKLSHEDPCDFPNVWFVALIFISSFAVQLKFT